MTEMIIRNYMGDEAAQFVKIQGDWFRNLEFLPRVKTGLGPIDRDGSFIEEKEGTRIGHIERSKQNRPKWFEIKNLAVKGPGSERLAKQLLARAVAHVESTHPQYLTASTPAVQPFVGYYKEAGFEPTRRSVRISWNLSTEGNAEHRVVTRELSEENADDAAEVWVKGLRPYWDYWIEENGGPEELAAWVRQSVPRKEGWIGAFIEEKLVGLTIIRANSYGPGEARFNGAYVLPEFRERGIGSALMDATIRHAHNHGQNRMTVYTLALLDHLAPGAILYLKSGGRIEAEYLQLQKKTRSQS